MGTSPDFYHSDRLNRLARRHRREAYLLFALLGASPVVFLYLALAVDQASAFVSWVAQLVA